MSRAIKVFIRSRVPPSSLVAAVITFGGVESRLQREGRDSDFPQNEAHKVTLVTSTPAPRMFIPLWYPGMVSAGRAR